MTIIPLNFLLVLTISSTNVFTSSLLPPKFHVCITNSKSVIVLEQNGIYLQPSAQNEDILVVPEMEFCQSKRMTIFLGSIYVYKGLLMVMTLDDDTFALCSNITFPFLFHSSYSNNNFFVLSITKNSLRLERMTQQKLICTVIYYSCNASL